MNKLRILQLIIIVAFFVLSYLSYIFTFDSYIQQIQGVLIANVVYIEIYIRKSKKRIC